MTDEDLRKDILWLKQHAIAVSFVGTGDSSTIHRLKRSIEHFHNRGPGGPSFGSWHVGEAQLLEAVKICGFQYKTDKKTTYVGLDYDARWRDRRVGMTYGVPTNPAIYVVQWAKAAVKIGFADDLDKRPKGAGMADYILRAVNSIPGLFPDDFRDHGKPDLVHVIRGVSKLYEQHLHMVLEKYRLKNAEGKEIARELYQPRVLTFVKALKGPEGCEVCL